MGKKGGSKGLKRKPAPTFWPIHRKEFVWTIKPKPGPHSLECCLPLAIVMRELLDLAKTRKEAKKIVSQGEIHVDGKIRREDDFPVSLMDVVFIPTTNKAFRVWPSSKGLILHPIDKKEATFKLCRIENKKNVRNGHVQLNLHDGSNILVKVADPKNPQEDVYETLNTIKVGLPNKQILEHIKIKKNAIALITGGKNIGKHGKIVEIEDMKGQKRRKTLVKIQDKEGQTYQTIVDFVFVIGEAHPSISLPEDT
jgi:small subunit ribosomal protein S4e